MRKTTFAAVPLAFLALALPSAAQAKRAVTYEAKLAPTAGSTVRGKATLTDGKRRDRVKLRLRGLEAGATYSWSLRKAPAGGDACAGEEVASFSYGALRARGRGGAKARSRGAAFAGGAGVYAVLVTNAGGAPVACLALRSKAQRKAGREAAERQQDEAAGDSLSEDDDELADDDTGDALEEEGLGEDEPLDDDPGDEAEDEL